HASRAFASWRRRRAHLPGRRGRHARAPTSPFYPELPRRAADFSAPLQYGRRSRAAHEGAVANSTAGACVTSEQLRIRGFLSLLFHGEKAIDVVEAALSSGLLSALDAGPVTLPELGERLEMRAERLDKMLDCLDSLG